MTDASLSLGARLALAVACFFKLIFDGSLAARVARAMDGQVPALPPGPADSPAAARPAPASSEQLERCRREGALQLLGLLQRDGRLIDFLQQDIAAFSDADVGAAARVVHEGSRGALGAHATVRPVTEAEEGAALTLEAGFDAVAFKLTGNVAGSAPFSGVVRHRGWRADDLRLPELVEGHDPSVLAPAEVEL